MEAGGRYVFACDKATELGTWILCATRHTSYLDERCWLPSVASRTGEVRAILSMPFDGDYEGEVFNASLRDTSEVYKRCLITFYTAWQQWRGACTQARTVR